jgi:hypothetical protein
VKSPRSLFWCALALCSVPSLAWGDEPSLSEWAQRRVTQGLIKPLAENEGGSRFSRARQAPRERRARVIQASVSVDRRGRAFVPFAVDVRFGDAWHENDIVGCVYRGGGELYVKRGDAYRPVAFLFGKNAEPVAGVCEAAPPKA